MNSLLMLVKIGVYRAAIGLVIYSQILMFYFRSISNYYVIVNILLTLLFVLLIFIVLANDVESNPGPTSLLNFGHLNVRSLNNQDKFDELSLIIKDNNFHVFAVSETWLNNNISSENFNILGYNSIMRLDRIGRTGGGVALFSIDSLVLKRRQDLELPELEFLWAEFNVSGRNFLCGVCYRPPDNDSTVLADFFNGFQFMLDRIRMLGVNYNLVILGDFNAHYSHHSLDTTPFPGHFQ